MGKPEPSLSAKAREALGNRAHVAMVGDHLIADIAGARQAGLPTILVLSGVTAKEDFVGAAIAPELALGSVAELSELLTSRRRQGRTSRT